MKLQLKYGCNPNQSPAHISIESRELPFKILNGSPGYINFLDALNAWQLVKELSQAFSLPAAASFKHVSPAGASLGLPLNDTLKKMNFIQGEEDFSSLCCAYIRARSADRLSSFGDFIALSDVCDVSTASVIAKEVSDGIIAPGYDERALEILKAKRKGSYSILQIDPCYIPCGIEKRDVFGITLEQARNTAPITPGLLKNIPTKQKDIPENAVRDLLVAMITLKYTQSNSVCYAEDGQTIGIGAGQQSRIHCTRLAGNKADLWHLRQHNSVLALPFLDGLSRPAKDNAIDIYLSDEFGAYCASGEWASIFSTCPQPLSLQERQQWLSRFKAVSLASDAFFPFGDNIRRAHQSGVAYIAQPGGSIRDLDIIKTCDEKNIAMAFTNLRLFHH